MGACIGYAGCVEGIVPVGLSAGIVGIMGILGILIMHMHGIIIAGNMHCICILCILCILCIPCMGMVIVGMAAVIDGMFIEGVPAPMGYLIYGSMALLLS